MELNDVCTSDHHEAGAVLEVRHPVTDEPTDIRITMRGTDSPTFQKAARVYNKRKSEKGADEKATEIACEMLVAVTLNITGITKDGEPVPFSKEMAMDLYIRSPGIRTQAETFITDRKSFATA